MNGSADRHPLRRIGKNRAAFLQLLTNLGKITESAVVGNHQRAFHIPHRQRLGTDPIPLIIGGVSDMAYRHLSLAQLLQIAFMNTSGTMPTSL